MRHNGASRWLRFTKSIDSTLLLIFHNFCACTSIAASGSTMKSHLYRQEILSSEFCNEELLQDPGQNYKKQSNKRRNRHLFVYSSSVTSNASFSVPASYSTPIKYLLLFFFYSLLTFQLIANFLALVRLPLG